MQRHLGTEFARNYWQQNFIILGLRKALRHIRHHSFLCRRFQGKGLNPFMAYLSAQRFGDPETNPYPFKNVGLDYIGPLYVAEKDTTNNYIRLFTYLTTRAIYLETTDNLTTENSLTAIRRFMARLGSPKLNLSDNLAYFVAARKQIMKKPLNINKDKIATMLQLKSIEWRLNPSSAPHFGGVW